MIDMAPKWAYCRIMFSQTRASIASRPVPGPGSVHSSSVGMVLALKDGPFATARKASLQRARTFQERGMVPGEIPGQADCVSLTPMKHRAPFFPDRRGAQFLSGSFLCASRQSFAT